MTTKNLDLRNLIQPDRLAKINEAVAVHCAGYVLKTFAVPGDWMLPESKPSTVYLKDGVTYFDAPPFSTSADAVLPLLEKESEVSNVFENRQWFVGIALGKAQSQFSCGMADTFPVAACYALLRANGVEVLTDSA